MGKLDGKVAFITGAARGQGRSHAVRLAQEGADVVAVDICAQVDTVAYPMSTPDDLAETVRQVEALDRRIVASETDVRDQGALRSALDAGVAQLGGVDIVVANAGIGPMGSDDPVGAFHDVVDINLAGVWNAVRAAAPRMIEQGRGGAMVLTSSVSGIKGVPYVPDGGMEGYVAAKHGVVGLMRTFANQLAPHSIRVNSVHPTGVNTPMVVNDATERYMEENPELGAAMQNALPIEMVEPVDISNAVCWLVSDDARYVTGVTLPVDAGNSVR